MSRRPLATTVDLLARGREHPPRAAELVHALAGRLTGPAVGDEVVERMPRVRHLELAVLPAGRPEQRRPHTGSRDGLAVGEQRRPERGARAVAGADVALVLDEVVERYPPAVDEDPPERRAREMDLRARALGVTGDGERGRERRSERGGGQRDDETDRTSRGHGPLPF